MRQHSEREAQLERCLREELGERMLHAFGGVGVVEPLPGLHLHHSFSPTIPVHGVTEPSFCVIAQGSKEVFLGEERYQYDPYSYLLSTVELPIVGQIIEASKERPYLALRLVLDPAVVGSIMMKIARPLPEIQGSKTALSVSPLDVSLLDAVVRLVRLLDCPTEARVLLPFITREIIYRLLVGPQGHRLRQMTVLGGHTHRVAQAVQRIHKEYDQHLQIDELARQVGMSVSSFHQHFKAVTAMSPLQFQKQLRLQEARRLMIGEDLDAAAAGFRVGYEDPSQFSREYKRLFGVPPMRYVERLRETAAASADI
jgi:AraC-like DNA-binding protein